MFNTPRNLLVLGKLAGISCLSTLLLTACGSDSNNYCCDITPAPLVSSSSQSSSDASSSSSSSVDAPSADLSFGFSEGIEPWYINGSGPGIQLTTELNLEHDQVNSALKISPLDWTAQNWKLQARYDFETPENFTDSTIHATFTIPDSYITDGALSFQLIIIAEATNYGGTFAASTLEKDANGNYTISREIDIASATGIGIQLASPPTNTAIKDPILLTSVVIERPEGTASSSSSSSPANDKTITLDTSGNWSPDGSAVAFEYTSDGVKATPDWSIPAQYGYAAMTLLEEAMDLTGASITFVISVPESFVSGGVSIQPFAQQNSGSYNGIWSHSIANSSLVAGDNTYTMSGIDGTVKDLQRVGIKLSQSGTANPAGAVTIKSIVITLP